MRQFLLCVMLFVAFLSNSENAAARPVVSDFDQRCVADINDLRAAELGASDAQYKVGKQLLGTDCNANTDGGVAWLLRSAEQGHVDAIMLLATLYEGYEIISADEALAIHYYRVAAHMDIVEAQNRLGVLLVSQKTPNALNEGLLWLGAAAAQGDGVAAAFLGVMHANGFHGLEQDGCLALDWFEVGRMMQAPVPIAALEQQVPEAVKQGC